MTYPDAMQRVLELAKMGAGYVSPNPLVGAVILRNGEIISEGYHQKYGEPHAEVMAIRNLTDTDLSGTTLVVNLEPCCHIGKTPPCTDLIISKNISRVVIGMQDPNPLVAGKGIKILQDAGIKVICGVLEKESLWLNRFFIKHITKGLPYITAKVAQSLDGNISALSGDSKWISSEESRKTAHKMRSEIDAILVGRNTVDTDNPELTVRAVKGRNPVRVILDSYLSLDLNAKVLLDSHNTKTIICSSESVLNTDKAKIIESSGVHIQAVDTNSDGKIDLHKCLKLLLENYNIASILVEGGSGVLSSFLKENLIDELHIFLAPIIIGNGKSAFSSIVHDKVSDSDKFLLKSVEISDKDIHLTYLQDSTFK